MTVNESKKTTSRGTQAAWWLLIILSALLILAGVGWLFSLPEMMLENIAEYGNVEINALTSGNPSAFDIITLITQGYGLGFIAIGLLAVLLSLEGKRNGSRIAWQLLWVIVFVYIGLALTFFQAGENVFLSLGFLAPAVLFAVALMLARRSLTKA